MLIRVQHTIEFLPNQETTDSFNKALALLTELVSGNKIINKKLDDIMANQQRFDEMLTRLNASTSEIASDLQRLRDEIAAGTVSDESMNKLEAAIASLEQMGQDPENPIPTGGGTEGGAGTEGGTTGGEGGATGTEGGEFPIDQG